MPSFSRSAANALGAGYDFASAKTDSSGKTAYQRYIEKYYGPDVTSHNDPIAIARAATGAVAEGLKTGAGWLGHAAAGLLGAPQGPSTPTPSRASSSQEVVYGGRGGGGAAGRMPSGNISSPGAGLSSPGPIDASAEQFFQAISEAEGTTKYGYNTVYGGANGIGGRPLTSMSLRELTDYQKGMIPRQGASPMGKFQINRGTVLHHATKLGLDLDKTVFDEPTQKKLALSIAAEQGIAPPVWDGFRTHPKQFAAAKAAYASIKGKPVSALAYASTDPNLTPAQQAAAAQAAGTSGSTSGVTDRGEHIAAMQRDLNSRGAKLTVDGLEGPQTRAAEQQFYGSPTSVRTPSFTDTPEKRAAAQAASPQYRDYENQRAAARTAQTPASPYINSTGSAYTSGRQDTGTVPRPGTPTYTSRANATIPYSGRQDAGTIPRAGVSTLTPRPVQTVAIQSDVAHKSPLPSYYQSDPDSEFAGAHGFNKPPVHWGNIYGDDHLVPTVAVPYNSTMPAPLVGGFVRPNVPQTPSFMNPYTASTGGANAITARVPQARPPQPGDTPTPYLNQPYTMPAWGVQAPTARIPQARPNYQPPEQAVPTLIERLDNLVQRAERALGGNRGSDSRSSSGSRSGGSNYSGGNYGGQGGSRISEGVGGAFRNR